MQATIEKINFSPKGPQTVNFPFIDSLKTLGNATKQDVLLFVTLHYNYFGFNETLFIYKTLKPDIIQLKKFTHSLTFTIGYQL